MELCQLASDFRGRILPHGMMLEQKIDGVRGLVFQGIDGITRMFTRKGYIVEGTAHILYLLSHMERLAGEPMVWDGEFQVDGCLEATERWANDGWKQGREAGHFHLFDCLPFSAWQRGGDPTPLFQRKAKLQALHKAVIEDEDLQWEFRPGSRGDDGWLRSVSILPDTWVVDPYGALSEARRIWAEGGEGVVLKDAEAPYLRQRNAHFLKMTRENALKWGAGF
jgi:ATP-dependent DNA ligase